MLHIYAVILSLRIMKVGKTGNNILICSFLIEHFSKHRYPIPMFYAMSRSHLFRPTTHAELTQTF